MKTDFVHFRVRWGLLLILLVGLVGPGCAGLMPQDQPSNPDVSGPPPASAETPAAQPDPTSPVYHHFQDVLFPGELNLDSEESFVYHTGGFTAGFLLLKGRVDGRSLIDFFENNMVQDNWQLISSFQSARTLLLFAKQNRNCVLIIEEKSFTTNVKVWVAPTQTGDRNLLLQ